MRGFFWGLCAFILLAGCGGPSKVADETTSSETPVSAEKHTDAPIAGSKDTSYRSGDRESSTGKKLPTLARTTNTESVEYYNPNTGTTNSYDLEVDRDDEGNIERINFPNMGWLEVDGETEDNGDGTETYTTSDGVEYTITKPDKPDGSTDE